MKPAVVIVGGTGVFGGRLARRLIAQNDFRVIVGGRDQKRLRAFCDEQGCEPLWIDRHGDLLGVLSELEPFAIVDAAGPFQRYGADPYRLVRAALALGSHYLDLSDDGEFTASIAELDEAARAAGVAVLSGVSSVPTISAAAVRELSQGLRPIELIDTVILPGNRAPRGLSVVTAIVSQVGRPLALFRGGYWTSVPAWSGLQRVALSIDGMQPLDARWASCIGAPDLRLFPAAFAARSVLFRAGLELSVMHLGLWGLSWLVRTRLLQGLTPLASLLHRVAQWLEPFGSDRGGMRVAVTGINPAGQRVCRQWTLIAEAGAGPEIPAIPAYVVINMLHRQRASSGARACLDLPKLADLEVAFPASTMRTAMTESPAPVLYERILGSAFSVLPAPLQELHSVVDFARFAGRARIEVGTHPLAALVRRLMRFPAAAEDTAVEVTMQVDGQRERWTRRFGDARFVSVLRWPEGAAHGAFIERFGPFSFDVHLIADETGIGMPVHRARFLGLPLPRWVTPESRTREFVDDCGRACFDVEVVLPGIGRMVRYSGWLKPVGSDPSMPPI